MELIDELRQGRIVVADQDAGDRTRVRELLQEAGFSHVRTLASGQEVLDCLQQCLLGSDRSIDLLLLSTRLADLDAHEICHLLRTRAEWDSIPAVLMTDGDGWWTEEQARSGYRSGATDILFKPVRTADFVSRVFLALSLRHERNLRLRQADTLETELAERKVMEARLQYIVSHDELTGLANRRHLEQALDLTVMRSRNFRRTSGLLYLDLDRFKLINDIEGHEAGDRLLMSVAKLIRKHAAASAVSARIGSDEFCVLYEDTDHEQLHRVADALLSAFRELHFDGTHGTYSVSASIGMAVVEPDTDVGAGGELLARANQACYVAKSRGGNSMHEFTRGDGELKALRRELNLVPKLRHALENDGFLLMFQPIVSVADGSISHYEALLRMQGESERIYYPEEFIPLAERMGLIQRLDFWVVEKAIDVLASLPAEHAHVKLNVNLSSRGLQDPSLLNLVRQKLEMKWVPASRIIFEITETTAISSFSTTREMIARLRALGCGFALDDFGTGFSSFSYVKNFPVDHLKIDGTFVVNLIDDPTDQVLVKSMIEVGHTLGKKVVAEYVENEEVLQMLRRFGVDYVQGFHLGRPGLAPFAQQGAMSEFASRGAGFSARRRAGSTAQAESNR